MDGLQSPSTLLTRAIAGDHLAVQQLLLRHHDRLVETIRAKLLAKLRGTVSPEDVCQEAYIVAIRKIGSFEPEGDDAFFGWLRTIADRKLRDAIRAGRAAKRGGDRVAVETPRADTASVVALLDIVAVHERTPSRSIARREAIGAIQDAVAKPPDDYREVIRLRYVEGCSAAETAEQMKRGEGAVRMLCMRALERLGKIVGDPARLLSSSG